MIARSIDNDVELSNVLQIVSDSDYVRLYRQPIAEHFVHFFFVEILNISGYLISTQ